MMMRVCRFRSDRLQCPINLIFTGWPIYQGSTDRLIAKKATSCRAQLSAFLVDRFGSGLGLGPISAQSNNSYKCPFGNSN